MATKITSETKELTSAAAAKAAKSDIEALKEDMAQLRNDISSLVGHSGTYVKGRSSAELEKGLERGKVYADKASDQAGKTRDYVEKTVRDNPLAALGIAFGTGVLLAALRRK